MAIKNKANDLKVENDERISFIADLPYSAVDDHVENLFSNLSAEQKAFLKKLTKLVLYLIKK